MNSPESQDNGSESKERPFPTIRTGLPATAAFDWLRKGLADL